MSLGNLVPGSQHRRVPRERLLGPSASNIASLLFGVALIVGIAALVAFEARFVANLRGWHVELVVPH